MVDLETTGLPEDQRAEILEVGIVLLDAGSATVRTLSGLIRPEQPIPLLVQRLTGLHDEDVSLAPSITGVAPAIADVLAGRTIIAHNSDFERHFLSQFVDESLGKARYLDTQDLFSVTHPETADLRLETLARSILGVEEQHRALADALDTSRLIASVAKGVADGEPRYAVARECLARFTPESPWLALVSVGATAVETMAFDAPLESKSVNGDAGAPAQAIDPFAFVAIGESREAPVPFDEDAIAAALCDEKRGRRYLPGYRVRHEQVELARHFTRNLARGGTLLLEGGTGVGKSFAYLAAAIPYVLAQHERAAGDSAKREPLVISTRTKLLQDQLLHKDIAAAARFLGYPGLRALSIKGRANYVCERRLQDVLAEGADRSLLAEDRLAYAVLLACARTRPHGEVGTLPGAFFFRQPLLRDMLRRSVATRAEQCTRDECAHQRECPFGRRRAALAKADLIVANHDLLLRWPPDYPKFKHVVIDEGHELVGVADEVYAVVVRPQELLETADELFPPRRRHGSGRSGRGGAPQRGDSASAGWRRDLRQDLIALGRSLEQAASEYGEVQLPVDAALHHPEAAALAERCAFRLNEIADTAERERASLRFASEDDPDAEGANEEEQTERGTAHLRSAAHALQLAFHDEDDRSVAAFDGLDRPHDRWTLAIRAVSPAEPFHEHFMLALDSTAILSASLFVDGDPFAALGELEIEERATDSVSRVSLDSPFPYRDNMRVIALSGGHDLVEQTALALAEIARTLHGRTLGLFTSLRRMDQVAQRLSQLLRGEGIEILSPRRANDDPRALVERFARAGTNGDGGAVLLGARTFWQGVDLPGPALQAVVIEKLPFEVPTELRRRREARIRAEGFDAFERFSLGKMLLHLKQMTGRLIRTEEDRGIAVIVEGRTNRSYFDKLVCALPPGVELETAPAERYQEALQEALREVGLISPGGRQD